MLKRYSTDAKGRRIQVAEVYTLEEHGIKRSKIDSDALRITDRLQREGFEAYIVGGAVRDLLTGKTPKDFDIVTDANPRRVKKIFWNSRIIGRRFRLVHVHFKDSIVEVATFRSGKEGDNNEFGTIEQDVLRRDFTINALYYDPRKEWVYDYLDAFKDVKKKRLKSLIPLDKTFEEDPVRMIRAVKYSAISDFAVERALKNRIKKSAGLLARVSASRLTEELLKILQSGYSREIIALAMKYGIFSYLQPGIDARLNGKEDKAWFRDLMEMDHAIREKGEDRRSYMIASLTGRFLTVPEKPEDAKILYEEIKELIKPVTPPNAEVEKAVEIIMKRKGLWMKPPRPKRRRYPNRKPAGHTHG